MTFNAGIDVSALPVASLPVYSGRISAIGFDATSGYWGSAAPSSPSATSLVFKGATFTVRGGEDFTVQTDVNNGGGALIAAELPVDPDLTGYAMGQTVGLWEADSGIVSYTTVTGLNTSTPTFVVSGFVLDVDDVVLEPRSRTDELSVEAVKVLQYSWSAMPPSSSWASRFAFSRPRTSNRPP